MDINIQCSAVSCSRDAQEKVREKLTVALRRMSHHIRVLQVRLEDVNGPKGGTDKRCVVEAVVDHRASVVVEATGENVVAAVARASRRIARRVRDEFSRARDIRRRSGRDSRREAGGEPETVA